MIETKTIVTCDECKEEKLKFTAVSEFIAKRWAIKHYNWSETSGGGLACAKCNDNERVI